MNKKLLLYLVLFVCLKSFSQQRSNDEILLFPNTTSSQVNLLLSESVKPTDISIYDLNGRLIEKVPLRNSSHYSIDTQAFAEGMYVVAISTPDETKIKKFVVDTNALNNYVYYDNSSNEEFNVVSLVGNTNSGTTDLTPIDDAYLQGSTRYNTTNVRVDGSTRTTYLKYDLSSLQGNVSNAILEFTIASDPGSGTISVYKGNGTSWTEENLSTSNRPVQGVLLGSTNKTYSIGNTHSITLNAAELGNSLLSLVVVHSNGNDTDFASKEHATFDPPTLVLSHDSDNTDGNDNNTEGNDNNADGITISPKDDAYLEGSTRYNTTNVRVDGSTRTTYLKYDLSSLQGNASNATLKFTVASDPGSGIISVYKGNGTNWTENNLSTSNRPSQGSFLGSINKTYSIGSTHTIPLNASDLGSSLLSLVVVHSNGNDTDFASKEHSQYNPPQLVINGGGGTTDNTSNNTGGNDNTADGVTLTPKHDAYLQGSTRYNTANARVDGVTRITYLKYDLGSVQGSLSNAELKFTVASDPGTGTISVYKGNGTNWTETNLSTSNRPSQGALLGSVNSTYSVGSQYSIPLNSSDLGNGYLSLVLVHSNGNDTDLATKEHTTYTPPLLILNGGDEAVATGSDEIVSIDASRDVVRGSTVNVSVAYSASIARDISVALKLTTSPWTSYKSTVRVGPGSGSVPVSVTVPPDALVANGSYNYEVLLLPTGQQGYNNRVGEGYISNVSVTDGLTDDDVTTNRADCTEANYSFFTCGIDFEIIHNIGVLDILNTQFDNELLANFIDEGWARDQRPLLTEEINRQLNTDYSSYDEAKKAFTENYVRNIRKVEDFAESVRRDFSSEAWRADQEQTKYTEELFWLKEWEKDGLKCTLRDVLIIDGFPQTASQECQALFNIEVRGKTLKSLGPGNIDDPSSAFTSLRNEVIKDFSDAEFEAGLQRSFRDGMENLINDGSLVNTFASVHNQHIDDQSIVGEIKLMVQYLWYTEQSRFGRSNNIKNPFPIFSNHATLGSMGQQNAPLLDDQVRIFHPNFVESEVQRCQLQHPSNPNGCLANIEPLLGLKEQIIQQHIDDFVAEEEEPVSIFNQMSNPCIASIIDEAVLIDSEIADLTSITFGGNSNIDLIFKEGNLDDGELAITESNLDNLGKVESVDIIFDNRFIENGTDLGIFKTAVHELVHANLEAHLSLGNISIDSDDFNLSILAEKWAEQEAHRRAGGDEDTNFFIAELQHEAMTDLVELMADAIEKYGLSKGYDIDSVFAEALAWGGLQGTVSYIRIINEEPAFLDLIINATTNESFYFEPLSLGEKCD